MFVNDFSILRVVVVVVVVVTSLWLPSNTCWLVPISTSVTLTSVSTVVVSETIFAYSAQVAPVDSVL